MYYIVIIVFDYAISLMDHANRVASAICIHHLWLQKAKGLSRYGKPLIGVSLFFPIAFPKLNNNGGFLFLSPPKSLVRFLNRIS